MADWKHINLRDDTEDFAAKYGFDFGEMHFAGPDLGLEHSGASLQLFKPGRRQPFGHYHRSQEEMYVIVAGSGRANLDGEEVELRKHDAIRVPPGTPRAFEAGPDGMEMVAFGAPKVAPGDGERLPDWWGG